MIRTKVLEFWGKSERAEIALWYNDLPTDNKWPISLQKSVYNLVEYSYNLAVSKYWVKYVTGQPYETANDMRDYLAKHGGLLISTDHNTGENDLMPPQTNLMFRFAHDIDHCMTEDCNFAFRGEICAYSKFAARTQSPLLRSWLFTEIVGQAAFRGQYGYFGEQKFAFAPSSWVDTVTSKYQV